MKKPILSDASFEKKKMILENYEPNLNYETARGMLESECSEFDHNPVGFIESFGWGLKKHPKIESLKGEINYTREDIEALANIIAKEKTKHKGIRNPTELLIAAKESGEVSDYVTNLMAQKILDAEQTVPAMNENKPDETRMMIREAFEEAYYIHKTEKMINEVSAFWEKKLSPERLANCNKLFEDALNQTGRYKEVYWQTAPGNKLNNTEMNYIFDKFCEGYLANPSDGRYKRAIAFFYNPSVSKDMTHFLYMKLKSNSALDYVAKTAEEFVDKIWYRVYGRIFAGGTITKRETGENLDKFERMMMDVKRDSTSFGSFFSSTFMKDCLELIDAENLRRVDTEATSLNAPSPTTGKERDPEGGMEDAEQAAYGDPESTELYGHVAADNEKDNSEDMLKKVQTVLKEIANNLLSEGFSKNVVIVFEETVFNYLSPQEIFEKFPNEYKEYSQISRILTGLKNDPRFKKIASKTLQKYDLPGDLLNKIAWSDLYKAGKELKNKKPIEYVEKEPDTRYPFEENALLEKVSLLEEKLKILKQLKNESKNGKESCEICGSLLKPNSKEKLCTKCEKEENGGKKITKEDFDIGGDINLFEIAEQLNSQHLGHDGVDKALEDLNLKLGGSGVEAIRGEDTYVNHYYRNIVALYVNMGDAYIETMVYDTSKDLFIATSYGKWYEENGFLG